MHVYITKYALTRGIIEADGKLVESGGRNYMSVEKGWASFFLQSNEWRETLQDAQYKARQMRDKKILSLQAQIKSLEAIQVFPVVNL